MKTTNNTRLSLLLGALLVAIFAVSPAAHAQYVVTTVGVAVTENFNSYNGTAAPANWTLSSNNRTSPANTANGTAGFQGNDTGSSATGGWRNYGTTGSGSLGYVGNGNFGSGNGANNYPAIMTTQFQNSTGGVVTSFLLGYTGEQWRHGGSRESFILVYYSLDGSAFTQITGLTFNSLNVSATGNDAALNGDVAANRTVLSAANVNSLSVVNGNSIYFRWTYNGSATGAGSRQGLSIDDISVTFNGGGAPVATDYYWTGGDGTLGGSGTWATTGSTWSATNSPITEIVWDSSKKAIFAGTAGTVTVSTVSANNGLVFSNTGYSLTNGTLTLGGASQAINSVTTDTGVTTTIGSTLAGTAGLTKAGAGTLVLSGANSFSGGIALSAGGLSVSAANNLGDAGNDIAFGGGTLVTTASFETGSGMDFSGSGTIDIAGGTTLTNNGAFNMSALTLSNTGTLQLNGATRTVGNLAFTAGGTLSGSAAISATSLTADSLTSGTATVNPDIVFSSGSKNTTVGGGGNLVLNGNITGLSVADRITKLGAGTLVVNGTSTGGYRLGAAGTTNGGTLVVGSSTAIGANTFQFNYGTLAASAPMTITNVLSIGGRDTGAAVIGGSNAIEFSGPVSWFTTNAGNAYLNVDNSSTFSGVVSNVATTATKLVFGGAGTMTLSGSSANTFTNAVVVSNTLTVNLNKSASTTAIGGNVEVQTGAKLLISASEQVVDTSVVTLSGGTIQRASGVSETFGNLNLTANSFLNFGGVAESRFLQFDAFTPGAFTLNVSNFLVGNQLRYDAANLAAGQALLTSSIVFSGSDGFSTSFGSGVFTITAIPEPSTYVAAAGLLALMAWPMRRRLVRDAKSILGLRAPMRDRLGKRA
jgi:autotransporter-associated beta strand protein